jgi:hypothetical protein
MQSDQPPSWLQRDSATVKCKLILKMLVEISKFPSHQETWLSDETLANILTHQLRIAGDNTATRRVLNCAVSQGRTMLASAGDCNNVKKAACQHKHHVANGNGNTQNTQLCRFLASPASKPPKSLNQSDLAWHPALSVDKVCQIRGADTLGLHERTAAPHSFKPSFGTHQEAKKR